VQKVDLRPAAAPIQMMEPSFRHFNKAFHRFAVCCGIHYLKHFPESG